MSIALAAKVEALEKRIEALEKALYQHELRLDGQSAMILRDEDKLRAVAQGQKRGHKHG